MIEAVDWRHHDRFFTTCARLPTDRGRMAGHAITIADGRLKRAKLHDDFIRAMVFPGGCLPSVGRDECGVGRAHLRSPNRRPGGHRPAVRRDAEVLAGQFGTPTRRRGAIGIRRAFLATVDSLPVLLRGGVPGAPRVGRTGRAGEAARHLQTGARSLCRPRGQPGRRSRSSMTTARRRASPPLQTAASGAACSSPAMPPPPTSTGSPGLADCTARTIARRERSWFPDVTATATANATWCLGHRSPERIGGNIRTEVHDVIAAAAQEVGGHGGG